jgi:hypothetical protein
MTKSKNQIYQCFPAGIETEHKRESADEKENVQNK